MISWLNPRSIPAVLDEIDQMPGSYTLTKPEANRRVFWVLGISTVCLLIIHYLKFSSSFNHALLLLSEWMGHESRHYYRLLRETQFLQLFSYVWWTFWHLVGFVIIPVLVVKYVIKRPMSEMGVGFNDTAKHWRGYLLVITPVLIFVFFASFDTGFLKHYPFYRLASRSWFDLIAWECLYLMQFACLEFFFRGFLLQSLRPAMGANVIWVMCVPYAMIHFPKLWPEALGAILFGFFMGILALRSRSMWGGFFVHAGVAVGMDLASLIAQGRLPKQWWI